MRNDVSAEIVGHRFWAKVDLPDASGCLRWAGAIQSTGYGRFADATKGKTVLAHRFAYEIAEGEIPDGLVVDHLCRNRACVNPVHMELVTQRENILRGTAKGALVRRLGRCGRGHEIGEANRRSDSGGCRICQRAAARLRYARRTA